ncbi:MAG: hypothetical protein WAW96_13660 [Alphaproteobacteria bacterium]
MALRRDIENLRERLKTIAKGNGLILFAGALIVLVIALAAAGSFLLRPKPPVGASLDGPAFCRQCAALSRLENTMKSVLAKNEDLSSEDRERITTEIAGWQRRCSTLLCSAPQKEGEGLACKAPSASLLSELASIDTLSESLTQRTSLCSQGGCQSARCEQANAAVTTFSNLDRELRTLIDNPSALAGEQRQPASGFLFDQLGTLDETVLAAPSLVASDRFAAAEARILYLRDQAVDAEAQSPDSAEGLLADRLGEVSTSIEALAQARRTGVSGTALIALWRDFAESSSRLLVEAATLQAQVHGGTNVFRAMVDPEQLNAPAAEGKVCEGTLRLVQATEQRIAQALAGLNSCNQRADCTSDDEEGAIAATGRQVASGQSLLELLAGDRVSAAAALRSLSFQRDPEVALTTDLAQYFSGEAIAVHALAENNRCLADRGSHLVLARSSGDATPAQGIEAHALDPADSATWLFAAPQEPGTYRFVLDTSKDRGEGQFGASAVFAVSPPATRACSGFTGRWQTDFGVLTIYVRDGLARGSYRKTDERAGLLVGSVDGNTLTGRWTSELGDGGAKLTLGPNGRSFQGTWSQYADKYSGAGKWDGQCIGAAGPNPSAQPGR